MKISRLSSKLLILAASASMVFSALGAAPAFAGHDPAPALQGLHAPGGTGKITGNSYLFRPVKIASLQVAMANGTRVSATRFGAQASCPPNLCYNGGPVLASPHVYLVFWGLWWYCGRNCGNCPASCGNADSLKVENYLYNYWHQVGQRGESWATITSQYYDKAGRHPAFGQGVWGTGCAADGNCGWVAWQQDPPTTSPTVAELGNFASG